MRVIILLKGVLKSFGGLIIEGEGVETLKEDSNKLSILDIQDE